MSEWFAWRCELCGEHVYRERPFRSDFYIDPPEGWVSYQRKKGAVCHLCPSCAEGTLP